MPSRSLVIAAFLLALGTTTSAAAQVIVVGANKPGHGFSGFGSAPISNTAVLHSYMDSADSGATLGFAVAIRGTNGWYNAHTQISNLVSDSLAAGEVGQRWAVGPVHYQFIYNATRKTLVVFDTTLSLETSRVVLVSLPSQPGARPTVTLGQPITVTMPEPALAAPIILQHAPEIRAFAGLP